MPFLLLIATNGLSHEVRPALLQIRQVTPGTYDLTWKVPRTGDMVLRLVPVFPPWFRIKPVESPVAASDAALFRYRAEAQRDIHQMRIDIEGIRESLVDVLVYVELLNGERHSLMIQPAHPSVVIPARETFLTTAASYTKLGVEHILLGPDHLLFVASLLLIVAGAKKLVLTVTAFTIAHSLTLSLSVLGVIGIPGPPVEATIALSIMFLALELLRKQEGHRVISAEKPWLVSFSFGLLHGLGFAGALQEVGLPQVQVPAALAFFNIGVELGQLLFIAGMLSLLALIRTLTRKDVHAMRWIPYGIGSVAAFWLIGRVVAFWG